MGFKYPVLVVVIASAVVLISLPAMFIFLAYHTHRAQMGWKEEHDRAVRSIEQEMRRSRVSQMFVPCNDNNDSSGNGSGNGNSSSRNNTNNSHNTSNNNRQSIQEAHNAQPAVQRSSAVAPRPGNWRRPGNSRRPRDPRDTTTVSATAPRVNEGVQFEGVQPGLVHNAAGSSAATNGGGVTSKAVINTLADELRSRSDAMK